MPVRRTRIDGRPAYRWGSRGTAYPYDPDDESSRRRALRQAQAQGAAIRARGYTGDADPGPRWRIAEQGAPSSREMQRILRAWVRRYMGPLYRELVAVTQAWADREAEQERAADSGGLSAAQAETLSAALREALNRYRAQTPEGMPTGRINAAAERAARVASANTRRHIVKAGASPLRLAEAMGVPREDMLAITGPLAPEERATFERWVRGTEVTGPDGAPESGLAKIRTIPQESLDGLEEWIVAERLQARRYTTIQRGLMDRLGIDERHAELIARDQVGKLNGAITRATQTDAGITEYTWRSSRDERVRELHQDLDGDRFAWNDPPESGTSGERLPPGLPIQCRCWADPVLPDTLIE